MTKEERIERVLNQTRGHNRTERYTVVTTQDIVDSLLDTGFVLDDVKVARTRLEEKQGYEKHLVTMRYASMQTKEGVPTVVIKNSHDGSSKLELYTGYIRLACLNGLIAGHDASISTRHKQSWVDVITPFVHNYQQSVHNLMTQYATMKSRRMSYFDKKDFILDAAQLRFGLNDYMDVRELDLIRRTEDRGDDLYRVFNRAQESLVKGEFTKINRTIGDNGEPVTNIQKAKMLTSGDELTRVNTELHKLALTYL
jgi:hypothetical protein